MLNKIITIAAKMNIDMFSLKSRNTNNHITLRRSATKNEILEIILFTVYQVVRLYVTDHPGGHNQWWNDYLR